MKKTWTLKFFILLLCSSFHCFGQPSQEGEKYLKTAKDYMQNKEYDEADYYFTQALKYIDNDPNIYYLRGKLRHAGGRYYSGAIADFNKAINLNDKVAAYYSARALSHLFDGSFKNATNDADKAITLENKSEHYDIRATIYGFDFSYVNAIMDFNTAITMDPRPIYYYKRSLIKKASNDFPGAEQDFNQALKLDPAESFKKEADPLFIFFSEQYFTDKKNLRTSSDPLKTKTSALNVPNNTIQGNEIQGVEIGSQIWMTKNLDIDRFSNGDVIPQAQSLAAWLEASKNKLPAWCYYEENGKLYPEYGKLYNLYAVIDKRGLAPKGWYLPKKKDWDILIEFCGGKDLSAYRLAYFPSNNNTSKPTTAAFSAILGGYRLGTISLAKTGGFLNAGNITEWWTSEANAKYPNEQTYYTCMYNAVRKDAVFGTLEGSLSGIMGYYIRCFKPGQTPVTPKPVTQVIAKATTPDPPKAQFKQLIKDPNKYIPGLYYFPEHWPIELKDLYKTLPGYYRDGSCDCDITSNNEKIYIDCSVIDYIRYGPFKNDRSKSVSKAGVGDLRVAEIKGGSDYYIIYLKKDPANESEKGTVIYFEIKKEENTKTFIIEIPHYKPKKRVY